MAKTSSAIDAKMVQAKRLALGLTQREFGRIIGVSEATVSNWETGRAKPERRFQRQLLALEALSTVEPDDGPFRPVQYLGSKARLADQIAVLLDRLAPNYQAVADLYSGSAVVSGVLAAKKRVVAIDRQAYAAILASAMLRGNEEHANAVESQNFQQTYRRMQSVIYAVFEPLVSLEVDAIDEALRGSPALLSAIIDMGSVAAFTSGANVEDARVAKALRETARRLVKAQLPRGFATATFYFAGPYFSYAQGVSLDALAAAIAASPEHARDLLTGVLLSTASHIVSTVGKQFAQPMRLIKKDGAVQGLLLRRALRDRSYDAFDIYKQWCRKWSLAIARRSASDHVALQGDVTATIQGALVDADIYYADPPYTIDHYSRFYHVLETLTLRDDPPLARSAKGVILRGLYRDDRYQSPFCIPSQVEEAFSALFAAISKKNKPLLLSYSSYTTGSDHRPRLLMIDALRRLAMNYFSDVTVLESGPHAHRKLNAKELNVEPALSAERFIVCRGKRG